MGRYPFFLEMKWTKIIIMMHISTPGRIPAMNSRPTDTLPKYPNVIRPIPGGIIGVIRLDAAVTAAENGGS